MSNKPINFYFLSSGFCGTRFYHHVLRLAPNAEVWHQPGHEEISEITNLMEQRFIEDRESILLLEIKEFPYVQRRIDKRLALSWIYGDTLNWMRGLGYMLYKYIGSERLRLVELIRHPTATCRSMLAHHRGMTQMEYSDLALAKEMANRWVRQYAMIRYQFEAIDDPGVCKTIRLEDIGLEQIQNLYAFLGLEGFDEAAIQALLENKSKPVRHSHLTEARVPASKEELHMFWRICGPLAEKYGYAEDERYYDAAPSRPVQSVTPALDADEEDDARPPLVKLFDHGGLGLIVRHPSGIHYMNQAGGPICFWLSAEGAFIPLADAGEGSVGQRLFNHFHHGRDKQFIRSIRLEDADFIDGLLAEHGLELIKVNRANIGKEWNLFSWQTWEWDELCASPWEAWVPVRIAATPYNKLAGVVSGVESADAILVWENSN